MQLNDCILARVGPGQFNEALVSYYQANGAYSKCLPDAEYQFLTGVGAPPSQRNDMWGYYLRDLGYGGALNDMLSEFWCEIQIGYEPLEDDPNWTNHENYEPSNTRKVGRAIWSTPDGDIPDQLIYYKDYNQADITIDVIIGAETLTNDIDTSFIAIRATEADNHLGIRQMAGKFQVVQKLNGVWSVLIEGPSVVNSVGKALRLAVAGNYISMSYDGQSYLYEGVGLTGPGRCGIVARDNRSGNDFRMMSAFIVRNDLEFYYTAEGEPLITADGDFYYVDSGLNPDPALAEVRDARASLSLFHRLINWMRINFSPLRLAYTNYVLTIM